MRPYLEATLASLARGQIKQAAGAGARRVDWRQKRRALSASPELALDAEAGELDRLDEGLNFQPGALD